MRLLQSTFAPLLLSLSILVGQPQTIRGAQENIEVCVPSDSSKGLYKGNCNDGDVKRSAILVVPDSIKGEEKAPLVMNLHALGINAGWQQWYSKFDETAKKYGFMVLYPEGYSKVSLFKVFNADFLPFIESYTWNAGGCCSDEPIDDIGFLRKLIEYVEKGDGIDSRVKVDEERIYVTGMSNGGFMTNRVACEMSDIIAAAVPVAGPLMEKFEESDDWNPAVNAIRELTGFDHPFGWEPDSFTCDPQNPVPLLHIHSTKDNVVPYRGSDDVFIDQAGLGALLKDLVGGLSLPFQPSLFFFEFVGLFLLRVKDLGFTSVEDSTAKWRKINNVSDSETATKTFGGGLKRDEGTECKVYDNKKPGSKNHSPVEVCSINSFQGLAGHCWPGKGLFQCGNEGVNNDYIWEFMSRYKKANVGGEAVSVPVSGSDEL